MFTGVSVLRLYIFVTAAYLFFCFFFFFQAEDGIRDYKVTGVQTCALPIATAPEQSKESGRNSRNRRSGDVPWSASGFAANPGGCGYSLPAQHRSGLIRHHLCRGALEMIDESCGILMPPDDAQALAATLRHLLQDGALFSRLGAEGPTRARYLLCPSRTPRPAPSF